MKTDESINELNMLESEHISRCADLQRLMAMGSPDGYTKAEIIDLENITGESLVTSEYPLAMFTDFPIDVGTELIGESLSSKIKEGVVKVYGIIREWFRKLFSFFNSNTIGLVISDAKKLYNGEYGSGHKVSKEKARKELAVRFAESDSASPLLAGFGHLDDVETLAKLSSDFSNTFADLAKDCLPYFDALEKEIRGLKKDEDNVIKTLPMFKPGKFDKNGVPIPWEGSKLGQDFVDAFYFDSKGHKYTSKEGNDAFKKVKDKDLVFHYALKSALANHVPNKKKADSLTWDNLIREQERAVKMVDAIAISTDKDKDRLEIVNTVVDKATALSLKLKDASYEHPKVSSILNGAITILNAIVASFRNLAQVDLTIYRSLKQFSETVSFIESDLRAHSDLL